MIDVRKRYGFLLLGAVGVAACGGRPPLGSGGAGGTSPRAELTVTPVDFGGVGVRSSIVRSVQISNSGSTAVALGGLSSEDLKLVAPFFLAPSGSSCQSGLTLDPGDGCSLAILF